MASAQDQVADREIATMEAEAEYLRARLTRVNAEIALARYIQQTFVQEIEVAKAEIARAESDLKRAEDRLEWSRRLQVKGYLLLTNHTAIELAWQKAKFTAEQARTKMKVLEEYTRDKMVKELRSEIDKAKTDESTKRSAYEQTEARQKD